MTKKFFTKVSPKAVGGIRRVYESKGYEVRAKIQTDGSVTVVAMKNSDDAADTNRFFKRDAKCKAEKATA